MRPINDRVILAIAPVQEKIGSIHVPATAQKKSNDAKVVAVGPNCTEVQKDDLVLISQYSGVEITISNETYLVVREDDILAILNR